jgi:hypothetical protein
MRCKRPIGNHQVFRPALLTAWCLKTKFINYKKRRNRALLRTALVATPLCYKRNCSSFEDFRGTRKPAPGWILAA